MRDSSRVSQAISTEILRQCRDSEALEEANLRLLGQFFLWYCNEEAVRLDPIAALIQTRGGQTGNGQRQ